jgi:hypothetical protein
MKTQKSEDLVYTAAEAWYLEKQGYLHGLLHNRYLSHPFESISLFFNNHHSRQRYIV